MAHRRVTVLGGGNGGRTAAVEFALAGHEVVLYDVPAFADGLDAIAAVRVMLAMDQTDQADTHIAEKYERIDTGKHTEAVKMYESGSDTDAV